MSALSEKVIVITGASSGIGEATAEALGRRGTHLVLAARRQDRLDALVKRMTDAGGSATAVACDVTHRDEVRQVIDFVKEKHGRIDVLINNAGIMPLAPMSRTRIDDWDAMIDVNLKGLLYGIGYALPIMLQQKTGHIINVSSVAGRKIFPGGAVYSGTKHAVHVISEGLRQELARESQETGHRIRVTVIAPGVVTTELPDSVRDEGTREATKDYYGTMEGPLQSADIAQAIIYALEAPEHVNVNEILIRPTAQVG